jgi:hypothetical protein
MIGSRLGPWKSDSNNWWEGKWGDIDIFDDILRYCVLWLIGELMLCVVCLIVLVSWCNIFELIVIVKWIDS